MSPVVALQSLPQTKKMLVAPSLRALVVIPLFTVEGNERNRSTVNNLLPSSEKKSLVVALQSLPQTEKILVAPSLCAPVVVLLFIVKEETNVLL
ncbi:RNA polymerase subunit sigma-70 [Sesbania bispinosa]|nr:RNA polymerase subunit sigma-70 [Sesbania bispinosa]